MNSNLIVQDDQIADKTPSEHTADIDYCANCNIQLEGQFCHSCGQSSKSMIKFFGEVIRELLDDTLGYDSRFKHSIAPLFLKPGRLSLDYVKGKRFHYVLPFKLYLITSVLLVLVIKNTTTPADLLTYEDSSPHNEQQEIIQEAVDETNQAIKEVGFVKDGLVTEDSLGLSESDNVLDKMKLPNEASKNKQALPVTTVADISDNQDDDRSITISTGDSEFDLDWDDETKRFKGVDEMDEGIVKSFVSVINPKLKYWIEDQGPLVDSIIEVLPYMMFIILPIFAIFLKLFYAFSKRYYTEHLVFLLHNHSFIYTVLIVQLLLGFGSEKLLELEIESTGYLISSFHYITTTLTFWMIIYVFIAMKRFYGQGWGVTIVKSLTLGLVYSMMLSFGLVFSLALGAYQA